MGRPIAVRRIFGSMLFQLHAGIPPDLALTLLAYKNISIPMANPRVQKPVGFRCKRILPPAFGRRGIIECHDLSVGIEPDATFPVRLMIYRLMPLKTVILSFSNSPYSEGTMYLHMYRLNNSPRQNIRPLGPSHLFRRRIHGEHLCSHTDVFFCH